MFCLKQKPKRKQYPKGKCAASRCREVSAVTDGSEIYWPDDVPLCDRHWEMRCDAPEEVARAA